MLFGFRGIRGYQAALAIGAGLAGVGTAWILKLFSDSGDVWLLAPALVLGLGFIILFATALRAPTSFVAADFEKGLMRIRVPPFVDTVISHDDILQVTVVQRPWWWGIGIRASFGGEVALLTAPGEAAQLVLRRQLRVWLIPRLIPTRSNVVSVTIRNPHLLAERFPAKVQAGRPKARGAR